uniref:Putative tropomyosin invertebrate n=1 Tax=Anopheles aquasalis TaxID=42839 RepID=T1DQ90_ANOAQ
MDAIKKKMQAMKLEKDNALDRALLCEQQARDANLRAEKAEEEARQLQKKIQAKLKNRSGSDSGIAHASQRQARGEGEGSAKR